MNLFDLPIPNTCSEMIQTFETYYNTFYVEMVRMSNITLKTYIKEYIDKIQIEAKKLNAENISRAAIGIVSLHKFGYDDFTTLSNLFDRLIPQTYLEYVRFTSWCAGNLICHPNEEQSKYVFHLAERAIGWIRAHGRRTRSLAAVNLLHELSLNSGNASLLILPNLKSAGWELVSHPSQQVLKDTAECLKGFVLAIMRYAVSEITSFIAFFYEICKRLLQIGTPDKEHAAFLILRSFMPIYPDYFVPQVQEIYELFQDSYEHAQDNLLAQSSSFCASACLCVVDPKFFVDNVADTLMEQAQSLILEFDRETVQYLQLMIKKVPDYMLTQADDLKKMTRMLFENQLYDPALLLLYSCIHHLSEQFLPLDEDLLEYCLKSPLTAAYSQFFGSYFNLVKTAPTTIKTSLISRIQEELKGKNQLDTLTLISSLPQTVLNEANFLYSTISPLAQHQESRIRSVVPKALYSVAISAKKVDYDSLFKNLFKFAMYEDNLHVRHDILAVLYDNCSIQMASPEYLDILKIFLNDDATRVRQITLNILTKLSQYNPLYVSSITRHSVLDSFFVLNQESNIRQKSRIASLLPDLIVATAPAVPTYSELFLNILLKAFQDPQVQKFTNFVEETSNTKFLIGLADSLAALAPLDPDPVSKRVDEIVLAFCAYLVPNEKRSLISSILRAFLVLLTPPCSNVQIRTMVPAILSACSSLLANTRSLRKTILRVIGAIGVIEVHQKQIEKFSRKPENIDEDLAREFYHPLRDTEGVIDETMLINSKDVNLYYTAVIASSLLNIFKDHTLIDLRYDTIQALVVVLKKPKMPVLCYFDAFVAHFLEILESSSIQEMKKYLPLYSELVTLSGNNPFPFVERSLRLILDRFCDDLMIDFFNLVKSFLHALGHDFIEFSSETICQLVIILDSYKTLNADYCRGVLEIFSTIGAFAIGHHYLIIPQICDTIDCKQTLPVVRVMAIESLRILVTSTDLQNYIGPIIRSLSTSLINDHEPTKEAAKLLLYAILDRGNNFLNDDVTSNLQQHWTASIWNKGFLEYYKTLLKEHEQLVNERNEKRRQKDIKKKESVISPQPRKKLNKSQDKLNDVSSRYLRRSRLVTRFSLLPELGPLMYSHMSSEHKRKFSEDSILSKIMSPNLGVGKHLENWLVAFIVTLISSSPIDSIRACERVANSYPPFASDLVTIAFYSCWQKISETGKELITTSFRELLLAKENYENVARAIFKILVFMHKVGQPISIPFKDIIEPAKRYGAIPFAIKLAQEDLDRHGGVVDPELLSELIDIYLQICNWTNAVAVWKMCPSTSNLANHTTLYKQLKMWDHVADEYKKILATQQGNPHPLIGLVESLSELKKWQDVISYLPQFNSLSRHFKQEASLYFAEAALQLGRWDDLDSILSYAPIDSLKCTILHALNSLHQRKWAKVRKFVDDCFVILASRPIRFFNDELGIHRDTMYAAQRVIEINEMMMWFQNDDPKIREDIQNVWGARLITAPCDFELSFNIISDRIGITQARDSTLIKFFQMHSVSLGTKTHMNAFDIIFPDFDFDKSPALDRLCYTILKYNTGEQQKAIECMEKLLPSTTGHLKRRAAYLYSDWILENDEAPETLKKAYNALKDAFKIHSDGSRHEVSFAFHQEVNLEDCLNITPIVRIPKNKMTIGNKTITRTPPLSPHPRYSKTTLVLPSHVMKDLVKDELTEQLLRKWAAVNIALISFDENRKQYATNAIQALIQCCAISPSFPDFVQLLHLFFEHGQEIDIFDNTSTDISKKVPPSLLLEAAPQLLVQLSHPAQNIANLVHSIIMDLLPNHYHSLIFSVIIITFSNDKNRANGATNILSEFGNLYPDVYNEVLLIRKSLLIAAVTSTELAMMTVDDAYLLMQSDQCERAVKSLQDFLKELEQPKCEMHTQFLVDFKSTIDELKKIMGKIYSPNQTECCQSTEVEDKDHSLSRFVDDSNVVSTDDEDSENELILNLKALDDLKVWLQKSKQIFSDEILRIQLIQLSSISKQLNDKRSFLLAVPGTYKPNKPLVRIEYFVRQIGVYMTKQQPKDVVIKGQDGYFYQYMLKGHEDLRLDERIMQFFKLINSFIKKNGEFRSNHIKTIHVIPLNLQRGLVEWLPGTDTLRSIIQQYRTLYNRSPTQEYELLSQYGYEQYDSLLPVQKMHILLRIFKEIPDTDLSNFFWIKASSVDDWHKQSETFAISTAMTSIVGYVIGLGDRNSSNVLVDRFTGTVVHIDFGSCFERAMKRSLLPEVVPFRLTRMMIRAMGVTGIHGTFKTAFLNMSQLLRENRNVLLMVLSIFVHEPLSDHADNSINQQIGSPIDSTSSGLLTKQFDYSSIIRKSTSSTFALSAYDDGTIHFDENDAPLSSIELRARMKEKLRGTDFEDGVVLSVEEQADRLLSIATNPYNLAKLVHGWHPFW